MRAEIQNEQGTLRDHFHRKGNLILTRKPDQQIQIGDEITITFTKIGSKRATVLIEAPQHVQIRRGEIEKH